MSKSSSKLNHFLNFLSPKDISSLLELREKILKLSFNVIIATCVFFLPLRLFSYDVPRLLVLSIYLGVSFFALHLIKINRIGFARLVLSVLLYVGFTILFLVGWSSLHYYLVVISLFSVITIFLRLNNQYLWIENVIILLLILVVLIQEEVEWLDITVTIIATNIFFYIVQHLIINLEGRLRKEIANSNLLNEKLKKKNEQSQLYANIMAHDIKAPLVNIKGFSQLIDKKTMQIDIKDSDLKRYFSHIYRSIDALENLINDLLIQSKIEQNDLKFEVLDLKKIIDDQLQKLGFQIYESKAKINLQDLGEIRADRQEMSILFNNLISNALKFQPIKENHFPLIEISQKDIGDITNISIADNGIGIDPKFLDDAFRPFKRYYSKAEYEGTGLGLAICKMIVDKHQGTLSVISEGKQGSKFIISLPSVYKQ